MPPSFLKQLDTENYFGKLFRPHLELVFKIMRLSQVIGSAGISETQFQEWFGAAMQDLKYPLRKKKEKGITHNNRGN